jgi:hypothetical protein
MGNYEIRIKVEMVEKETDNRSELLKEPDGTFTMNISESEATSIDKCEKSLLQTAYPAIREAIKNHMTDVSKKKHSERQEAEK